MRKAGNPLRLQGEEGDRPRVLTPALISSLRCLHLSRKGRCISHQESGPWRISLWRKESLDFGETRAPVQATTAPDDIVTSSLVSLLPSRVLPMTARGIILIHESDHAPPPQMPVVTPHCLQVKVPSPQCGLEGPAHSSITSSHLFQPHRPPCCSLCLEYSAPSSVSG